MIITFFKLDVSEKNKGTFPTNDVVEKTAVPEYKEYKCTIILKRLKLSNS